MRHQLVLLLALVSIWGNPNRVSGQISAACSGRRPDADRCAKLRKFFGRRPRCTVPGRRRHLCCAAASDFFTLDCTCSVGVDEALSTFVAAVRSSCENRVADSTAAELLRGAMHKHSHGGDAGGGGEGSGASWAQVKLLVGVLSAARHADRRTAIRQAWGGDARLYRVLFFVARPQNNELFDAVRREAVAERDVVILAHVWEAYDNITYQTYEVCRAAALDGGASHVMKVDDDSYVHVQRLLGEVGAMPAQRAFLGFMENPGGGPHRNRDSQWYVGPDEWPSERFPPWAHGAGYVLTADVAAEVATGVPYRLRPGGLFKLEDVSMGSWVEFVGQDRSWDVQLVHSAHFNYGGCSSGDLVSHYIDAQRQACMWRQAGRCCRMRLHGRRPLASAEMRRMA